MKQLKIRKDLWKDIVSGKKPYEFRKLSKGLTSGTYQFVSIDILCLKCKKRNCSLTKPCRSFKDNIIFGTAKLEPYAVNPEMNFVPWWGNGIGYDEGAYAFTTQNEHTAIDEKSYDFVKENYAGKHDFVVYEISEVNNGGDS